MSNLSHYRSFQWQSAQPITWLVVENQILLQPKENTENLNNIYGELLRYANLNLTKLKVQVTFYANQLIPQLPGQYSKHHYQFFRKFINTCLKSYSYKLQDQHLYCKNDTQICFKFPPTVVISDIMYETIMAYIQSKLSWQNYDYSSHFNGK